MNPVILPLPGNGDMAHALARLLDGEVGEVEFRRFPDGETFVRIDAPLAGREVILACTLARPDGKFLPLAFAAATARDLGAARVGLVAPYLAYLRQDKRFHDGEGVTSIHFGRLLSACADWLVTVDPHLHRHRDLSAVYTIPCAVAHAAPLLSAWIRRHVPSPLVIGPDSESEQWVSAVAKQAGAPYVVLEKQRLGDREVRVSLPPTSHQGRTPVLVDDIVSTARTMIEAVRRLQEAGYAPPFCVGVHGLFAEGAYDALREAGVAAIATCTTVAHPSNAIDVAPLLAQAVGQLGSAALSKDPAG